MRQLAPAVVSHLSMYVKIVCCCSEAEAVTWIMMFLDVFELLQLGLCFEMAEL